MTRTVPINGKFSKRQLQIYNAVLNVKNEANKILRPGTSIDKYHKEIAKIMESELLDIKLIDKTDIKNQNPKNPAYKRYFMHGTSLILVWMYTMWVIFMKMSKQVMFLQSNQVYTLRRKVWVLD